MDNYVLIPTNWTGIPTYLVPSLQNIINWVAVRLAAGKTANCAEIIYDACLACLLWRNSSFVIPPVACPYWHGSIFLNVLCPQIEKNGINITFNFAVIIQYHWRAFTGEVIPGSVLIGRQNLSSTSILDWCSVVGTIIGRDKWSQTWTSSVQPL